MSIVRSHRKKHNFQIIDSSGANDENLSYRARGILWYFLTKPDHWEVSMTDLERKTPREGREAIATAFKELEDNEYAVRICTQSAKTGQWIWTREVFECREDCQKWKAENQELLTSQVNPGRKKASSGSAVNGLSANGLSANGSSASGSAVNGLSANGSSASGSAVNIVINDQVITDLVINDQVITEGEIPPTPQVEILENEPKQIEIQAELVSVSDLNQHTSLTPRSTHEDQFSAAPKNQLEKFNATERFEQQFQLRQRSTQFEQWWEGYKRFCFQVDAIPGKVEDALQVWHQNFAQGVSEAFFDGDKAYQYQKRKQFLKRGDAIGVPGGAKYLKNQLWQEALERQREKDAMPDFTPADYRNYEQKQATRRVMSQAMEAIRQKEQQGDKNSAF